MTLRRCTASDCNNACETGWAHCWVHARDWPTPRQVDAARAFLADGLSLKQAAFQLGCMADKLDIALWHQLGNERRPEPMFD